MYSTILRASAFVAVANAHGVLLNAQGDAGSPASVGFQGMYDCRDNACYAWTLTPRLLPVDLNIPRNCTTISPCQLDATIIRDAEINANVVNECGRTELTGNIDVGENTEAALAAGAVTQVKAGSKITVTIHQVNADGAGPYTCDLDQTSNAGIISHNLTVTNNVPGVNGLSQAKEQDFNITVEMPADLQCTGASTGNICTVRCRNNAVAGPFGGCFAVQQTDVTPKVNTAANIDTAQSLDAVLAQVQQNQQDLPAALKANANAGSTEALQNAAAVDQILGVTVTTKSSPVQTPDVTNAAAVAASATTSAATTTTAASTNNGRKGNNNNNNNNGNGNGNNRNNKVDTDTLAAEKRQVQGKVSFSRKLRWANRKAVAGPDSL